MHPSGKKKKKMLSGLLCLRQAGQMTQRRRKPAGGCPPTHNTSRGAVKLSNCTLPKAREKSSVVIFFCYRFFSPPTFFFSHLSFNVKNAKTATDAVNLFSSRLACSHFLYFSSLLLIISVIFKISLQRLCPASVITTVKWL